jgi:hypothetical protein
MKLFLILILSLLLMSVSSAKQESLIMGPYKVSFDLNTTQKYEINNTEVKYGETYGGTEYVRYNREVKNNSNLGVIIQTTYYTDTMNKDVYDSKSDLETVFQNLDNYYNIKSYERLIDDQPGALVVGKNLEGDSLFAAGYWPKLNLSGDTQMVIISTYPWENGTLSLLKTIHVEMVGKPPI